MNPPKKLKVPAVARSSPRYYYIKDLTINYEGYGDDIRLQTPDISARGMFIHTSLPLPEGAVINVKFRLTRSNYEVSTRGEVRYCLPGVGVGVEFVEISPEAQQAIEEELGLDETRAPAET
jgi:hypothetical protein